MIPEPVARILKVRADAWEWKDINLVQECDEQLRTYGWTHEGPMDGGELETAAAPVPPERAVPAAKPRNAEPKPRPEHERDEKRPEGPKRDEKPHRES